MQIEIVDKYKNVLVKSHESGDGVAIVYTSEYKDGDTIILSVEEAGLYSIQLDDLLGKELVYLKDDAWYFVPVHPHARTCFHPAAFLGKLHVLTLEKPACQSGRRNLAKNVYDNHHTMGIFPHASANVETRREMVFAARNAIDGILENRSHGEYPYASWGINQDPEAELNIHFGRPVNIDEIRLTLRADWPHDSWWTQATITFDDGDKLECNLQKSSLPQSFTLEQKTVQSLTLGSLIKADDDASPFPALTQIEVFGTEA